MYIAYTPEQEALRAELRTYFAELMTPRGRGRGRPRRHRGPHCLEAVRKMGRDGWLGIGWPTEYGGQGRSLAAQAGACAEALRLTAAHVSEREFLAAEGGFRVAHAAQPLHGGIGVDTEYPLFRYFRWTRQIELTLGGAALHLVQLGGRIAARAG